MRDFLKKCETVFKDSPGHLYWDSDGRHFMYLSSRREGPLFDVMLAFKIVKLSADNTRILELSYEAYAGPKRLKHPANTLSVSSWTALCEVVGYVFLQSSETESDLMFEFLGRQLLLANKPKNARLYDLESLNKAFTLYASFNV